MEGLKCASSRTPNHETEVDAKVFCNSVENCIGFYWATDMERFLMCFTPNLNLSGHPYDVLHLKKRLSRKICQ